MRLLLATAVLLAALVSDGHAETVLERMRQEKAKFAARQANTGTAPPSRPDVGDALITSIQAGNVEGVRRYLAHTQSNDGAGVTDRMQNGAWHAACKVQSAAAAVEIASMFIKFNLPMNVCSSLPLFPHHTAWCSAPRRSPLKPAAAAPRG